MALEMCSDLFSFIFVSLIFIFSIIPVLKGPDNQGFTVLILVRDIHST